jgi:hypothetical protein
MMLIWIERNRRGRPETAALFVGEPEAPAGETSFSLFFAR